MAIKEPECPVEVPAGAGKSNLAIEAAPARELGKIRTAWECGDRRGEVVGAVHSQVRRIKEEDSHLGEDVLSATEKLAAFFSLSSQVDSLLMCSRPVLPSSPLGSKRPHFL